MLLLQISVLQGILPQPSNSDNLLIPRDNIHSTITNGDAISFLENQAFHRLLRGDPQCLLLLLHVESSI